MSINIIYHSTYYLSRSDWQAKVILLIIEEISEQKILLNATVNLQVLSFNLQNSTCNLDFNMKPGIYNL